MSPVLSQPMIRLRGVRHNNLKNFDLDLPLYRLIVVTGLSGSGKSSLAFDTLFAEGQRRYIETFSPYARQFFDRMDKPQVDSVEGIPPAIAIEQRNSVRTTRSTVGTMTELCDYLKVIWPHVAQLHCGKCGRPVLRNPPPQIFETLHAQYPDSEVLVTFDVRLAAKLELDESLKLIARQGYQRLLIDGQIVQLDQAAERLKVTKPVALTIIQDRIRLSHANRARFVEACEQAYHLGHGTIAVWCGDSFCFRHPFSLRRHCPNCSIEYKEPTPAMFSFNHPLGACPTCRGFGRIITIDFNRAIPDRSLSLAAGAVKPWRTGFGRECQEDLLRFCKARGVATDVPFRDLPPEHQRWVVDGDDNYGIDESHEWPHAWYGVKGYFRWLETKAYKMHVRVLLSRYRSYRACPDCGGKRLKPEALLYRLPELPRPPAEVGNDDPRQPVTAAASNMSNVAPAKPTTKLDPGTFSGLSLADFYRLPIRDALECAKLLATKHRAAPGDPIGIAVAEVKSRLEYLVEAGLGYLTLDRPTRTLSGGEVERVNLTACLGTRLVNTLFVLDEPSVGLHPRDTARLISLLERLRDAGNTVVVVEHDASIIEAADHIVDLGPGSGERGGAIVFQGSYPDLLRCKKSITGQYLSGKRRIEAPARRPVPRTIACSVIAPTPKYNERQYTQPATAVTLADALPGAAWIDSHPKVKWLVVSHANKHNLRDLSVSIPLGRMVCVTGVSGSGKTTLLTEVLLPALREKLGNTTAASEGHSENLDDEDGSDTEPSSTPDVELQGWENVAEVVLVDQTPIGRTPRSNPAIYVGAFDEIRKLYAKTPLAKERSYSAGAFSFNSRIGRCTRCAGAGFEKIEMQFLSDVYVRCPDCGGKRFSNEVLEVELVPPRQPLSRAGDIGRGLNIAGFLDLTVDEAIDFLDAFRNEPPASAAAARLIILREIGLGYLRLGQPINTLSGGECQRLKLAASLLDTPAARPCRPARNAAMASAALQELLQRKSRNAACNQPVQHKRSILFLLDEPTKGLHFDDVRTLISVFQRLANQGHSVVVIEHNLDVIKCADWVIDLGPEAGDEGGRLVVAGTPEEVAACDVSHTGRALRAVIEH
ncbi:MAG: excinuclease ABC subunit UvrA [Verrucomicrobia bacterium]|nr:excinuclease ABC subunit UvrA [Verrucomicrobiota bacterium]